MSCLALVWMPHDVAAFQGRPELFAPLVEHWRHRDLRWHFARSEADFLVHLPAASIIFAWHFAAPLYACAPLLRRIFTPAAGRDWIARDPSGRVKVHHGSFHGELISESLLAMILAYNNQIAAHARLQEHKLYDRNLCQQRRRLAGQHALFLGYGNIARACALRLHALGLKLSAIRRHPSTSGPAASSSAPVDIHAWADADAALASADHIICLLPATSDNAGLLSTSFFARLKPGAAFWNFGRGSVVDESALLHALDHGPLAFAGLDVTATEPLPPDSALWSHPAVMLTPHSSCSYSDYIPLFLQEIILQPQILAD